MTTVVSFAKKYGYTVEAVLTACETVGVMKHNGRVAWISVRDTSNVLKELKYTNSQSDRKPPSKEKVPRTEYMRKYREANKRTLNSKRSQWLGGTGSGTSRYAEKSRDWNRNNREKIRAYQEVHAALKSGEFKLYPCEVCGDPDTIVYYTQYERPLEGVVCLCRKHHAERRGRTKVTSPPSSPVNVECP
jgi:hypothetical protein